MSPFLTLILFFAVVIFCRKNVCARLKTSSSSPQSAAVCMASDSLHSPSSIFQVGLILPSGVVVVPMRMFFANGDKRGIAVQDTVKVCSKNTSTA